ncbi:MAG: anthranilate phosphoribosyltransferase [Allosphingosinicella sp.]
MYLNQAFAVGERASIVETPSVEDSLVRLYSGEPLARTEAQCLFSALVAGELSEPTIAAMLIALRFSGETSETLIGAASALRSADADFPRPDYLFADSCGTGGDNSGSINVSTAVAFVVAAAGLPIVKHGNRSFSSRCGSADVLERLGAKLDLSADRSRELLDETGFCFLFAPAYHPGLAQAGPVRRALKVRTIMNVLGPCLNPAEPPVQLLGVARPELLEPVAFTLAALGVATALVVHGSGLDEVALHGPTTAVRLNQGLIERLTLTPEQAGYDRAPLAQVQGGDAEENAVRLGALLRGGASRAERQIVALNAGALLLTAGLAQSFREGVERAAEIIAGGEAGRLLDRFVEASRG